VRAPVGQPVPVRWPAAEVAALLARLGGHRGADPDAGAGDLPLRLDPQRDHRLFVTLGQEINSSSDFGSPELHAVMLKQWRHQGVLAAVKGPLILPDNDRVELPVRISHRRHQRDGLWPARPRQHPALRAVEIFGHDPAVPGDQRTRLVPLPRPGGDRVLVILS